ncbi:MAG: DUF1415 domain-containing protein [Deltaproteobacteria bacterium]|nr:DUF1415 domain-containing protein [Deltaproteobacteria bacterium]
MKVSNDEVVTATRVWIEEVVIGLDLCPFAKGVLAKQQVRMRVSRARTAVALLADLEQELRVLSQVAPEEIDTTLLIHPHVLGDFLEYNDFLDQTDDALDRLGLIGVIQVASFHPHYQFAGSEADDITNYTNRSPYPMLHLLREASVERAVAAFPDASAIYEKNLKTMRGLSAAARAQLGIGGAVANEANPGTRKHRRR